MCEICHHVPCHPRCPNAPKPPEIYKCCYCDDGIRAGEEFTLINNSYFHKDCLSCIDVRELLDLCGCSYSVDIAETDELIEGGSIHG